MYASRRSICDPRSIPPPTPAPTHSAVPAPLNNRNGSQPTRVAPASGGASKEMPGTNLATRSALTPQLSNRSWVWLTHESGVSEIMHSALMTRLPYWRPARYHVTSAGVLGGVGTPEKTDRGGLAPAAEGAR